MFENIDWDHVQRRTLQRWHSELEVIDWFANMGRPMDETGPLFWEQVPSWDAALKRQTQQINWNFAVLKSAGDVNGVADAVAYRFGQTELILGHWNKFVPLARAHTDQVLRPLWERRQLELGFLEPDGLYPPVWAQLNAHNMGYARLLFWDFVPGLPPFFKQSFELLKAGHYVCGWKGAKGQWPEGRHLYY